MYMPTLYQEDDLATLHGLMRDYSFATLVTQHDGAPFATHLPLVLEADEGPYGTLYGHMARANPQWQDFHETQEVLVIFQRIFPPDFGEKQIVSEGYLNPCSIM